LIETCHSPATGSTETLANGGDRWFSTDSSFYMRLSLSDVTTTVEILAQPARM
jgi:hypothetical protein